MIRDAALVLLLAGAAFGCVFLITAARLIPSTAARGPLPRCSGAGVTILKPLHGEEPELFENLVSFCNQDYPGPVQIVLGVTDADDPAIRAVERLRADYPERDILLVVDPRVAGANPKVANLINMSARIRHEIVIASDSDIRVRADYLAWVIGTLEQNPGGAVTCLYYGIPTGTVWSRLSCLHIDGHFLPGVVTGLRLDLAHPCFGSTIAMRKSTLDSIGGFGSVADTLADDYEIGELLRRRGERVAVTGRAVGHVCAEDSFRQLWRHEVRWASTIRTIDPVGYAGWVVSHPLPLAVLGLAVGGGWSAVALAIAAFACRGAVLTAVGRSFGVPLHAYWLIPVRDLLSFAVFIAGFSARNVDWHGRQYRLMPKGTLMPEERSRTP